MSSNEFEVPVKRVNGNTLEDRMNSNGYNDLLPARYQLRNEEGEIIEEQEEVFGRVARNIAVAEYIFINDIDESEAPEWTFEKVKETSFTEGENANPMDPEYTGYSEVVRWGDRFEHAMKHLKFVPNTPTIINAGDDFQQLSACFVDSPNDDMKDIGETGTEASLIFQSGGGVGYDFSDLRPYGDPVSSTGGIASGPITFMQGLDQNCETVAQGGVRRGAQMGTMSIMHPDVIHFIHSKNKAVSLAHSLRLNDPDDPTYTDFGSAIDEARELLEHHEGKVPSHLRNAVEGHLSNFNISVKVTDDFMEALKNDEEYTLENPRTGEAHIVTEETAEMYAWFDIDVEVGEELSLPANEIWDRIVEGAYENGEPGIIYIDQVNQDHSYDVDENPDYKVNATNPCVAEGTLVNTPSGYVPVEEVEEGDEISTVLDSEKVDEILEFDDREVYTVEFSDGNSLEVTEDHRFHRLDGKKVEDIPLRDIEEEDYIRLESTPLFEDGTEQDYIERLRQGIIVGDGCYTEKSLEHNNRIKIACNEDEDEYIENIVDLFGEKVQDAFDVSSESKSLCVNLSDAEELIDELSLEPAKSINKNFDVSSIKSRQEAIGILDGLLASDGNVNLWASHPQIRWDTSSEDLAKSIRNALLLLGIHGRISTVEDPKRGGTINGRKISSENPMHTVTVSGDSAGKYADFTRIGDVHPDKGEKMKSLQTDFMTTGNTWKAQVETIEKTGQSDVYDLYCSESDTWITEGYVQRGCAEQPLMEYEACNLGHINLSTIVDENVTPWQKYKVSDWEEVSEEERQKEIEDFLTHAIDWDELNERIEIGTRFLDNVVTMSDFPIEEIEETVRKNRKIGLGVMGLAQLFIQLGVEYGSEEGNEISKYIMRYINHESKYVSEDLAEERGTFENWEDSKYADPEEYPEWFEKHTGLTPETWTDGFRVRNHNTTTIAPTGSTSILGDTSGGCEPIYNVAYYKNVTDDIQGDEMMVEFDSMFLRTLEANDVDIEEVKEEAEELMQNNEFEGPESLDSVPEHISDLFVTTSDLDSKEHASVLCALQDGVDSAISKTLNAPFEATLDDAKETFEYVYDNGGKSVTFYRDGTRTKQVNTIRQDNEKSEEGDEEDETPAPEPVERPKITDGQTHRIETGYGKLYVTINEDENGNPFEVFATVGKGGSTTESFTEALGRQASLNLRAGVDIEEVIDQLSGIRSPRFGFDEGDKVKSVPDGIALALDRYHNDGEEENEDEEVIDHTTTVPENFEEQAGSECPECGGPMKMQEGCEKCADDSCGYSLC